MQRFKGKQWSEGTEVEYLGGTKIRFTCPRGHRKTHDYSKGPVAKRMGEFGCEFMAKSWQRNRVVYRCLKCEKEDQAARG